MILIARNKQRNVLAAGIQLLPKEPEGVLDFMPSKSSCLCRMANFIGNLRVLLKALYNMALGSEYQLFRG